MLHGSPLPIELIVHGPGEVLLAAVVAALGARANLLSSTLSETEGVALRKHSGERGTGVLSCDDGGMRFSSGLSCRAFREELLANPNAV